jgi:RHS repeat-associated protein
VPVHRETTAANNAAGAASLTLVKPTSSVAGDVLVASLATADGAGGGGFSDTQVGPGVTTVATTATIWAKGTGTITPFVQFFTSTYGNLGSVSPAGFAINSTGFTSNSFTYTPAAGTAIVTITYSNSNLTVPWYLDDLTVATGGGAASATTVSAPSGWTVATAASSVTGVTLSTFTHTVAAGDPANWSFPLSQSVKAAGTISAYSGVDTTTPIDITGTGTNTTAGTAHIAPSVTTTGTNRLALTVNAAKLDTTMLPPAGSTERADQAAVTGAPTVAIETSEFPQTAAGATGAKTSTSAAATTSATATIALKPAAGGGSTTTPTTVSPASGWTAITTGVASGVQLTTWSHVVVAGDPASWAFPLSQSARAVTAVSAYSGVNTSTPVDTVATGTNISGTAHVAPSVTTTSTNRLALTITAATAVTTMTPPAGSTERADQAGGATAPTVSIETSDFPQPTTGATGAKTTTSLNPAVSATATITLRPTSTGGVNSTYVYNAQSQRISRTDGGLTTVYIAGTEIRSNGTATRYYTIAGHTIAMRTTNGGSGDVTWLFNDGQATTGVAWNQTTNTITRQAYFPYGQKRGSATIGSTDRGFIGQTEDDTTGLNFLNARYMDPILGRFASVDPLVVGTRDAYGYGRNNPVRYTDPSGMCASMPAEGAACFGAPAQAADAAQARSSAVAGRPHLESGDVMLPNAKDAGGRLHESTLRYADPAGRRGLLRAAALQYFCAGKSVGACNLALDSGSLGDIPAAVFWKLLGSDAFNTKANWAEATSIGLLGVVGDGSDRRLPVWVNVLSFVNEKAGLVGDTVGVVSLWNYPGLNSLATGSDIVTGLVSIGLTCFTGSGDGCGGAIAEAIIGVIPVVGDVYFLLKMIGMTMPDLELGGHGGGGFAPSTSGVSTTGIDPGSPILMT